MRIVLGVLVGLLVWGICVLVSDAVWAAVSPDWFGRYQHELKSAISDGTPFTPETTILLIVVIRSTIYSITSGVLTAIIARENDWSTLALGVILLVFGTIIHSLFWDLVPFWYHFAILFLFIPLTIFGGKLITPIPRRPILRS